MNVSKWSRALSLAFAPFSVSLALGCSNAIDDSDELTDEAFAALCKPQVPDVLAVPEGNKLAFSYDAVGLQIYRCDANAMGYGWVFVAPDARLYGRHGQQAGTHYAGPTWEANDGSTVVGVKIAEYIADPNSIPWLLLGQKSHAGQGRMTDVTYIQRLQTSGGKAPTAGCDAAHVAEMQGVDYTATYYFYEAR